MVWVKVFVRQTWEPVLNLFPHNHFKGYLRGAVGSDVLQKQSFWVASGPTGLCVGHAFPHIFLGHLF